MRKQMQSKQALEPPSSSLYPIFKGNTSLKQRDKIEKKIISVPIEYTLNFYLGHYFLRIFLTITVNLRLLIYDCYKQQILQILSCAFTTRLKL